MIRELLFVYEGELETTIAGTVLRFGSIILDFLVDREIWIIAWS